MGVINPTNGDSVICSAYARSVSHGASGAGPARVRSGDETYEIVAAQIDVGVAPLELTGKKRQSLGEDLTVTVRIRIRYAYTDQSSGTPRHRRFPKTQLRSLPSPRS